MSEQVLTIEAPFDQWNDGYIVFAPLSDQMRHLISGLQQQLEVLLPPETLWLPSADALHVTFAHLVSVDSIYVEPRDAIFKRLQLTAVQLLGEITAANAPVTVTFDAIKASPGAIYLQGYDDGRFRQLRDQFAGKLEVPTQTRRPPQIIHTTIAHYRSQIPLQVAEDIVRTMDINFQETFNELDFIHDIQSRRFELIQRFPFALFPGS